jgi:predicted enzyme related to lactoylglutathione lyase
VERVTAIGGVFLRSNDPERLREWYASHLGIALEAAGAETIVWATFPADTDYFGSRDQQAMLNYRVADLDAMLAQLRAAGADVDERVDESEYGRFGWAADCDGNRFELWQPPVDGEFQALID